MEQSIQFPLNIEELHGQTESGNLDVSILLNDVPVTGLSGVNFTAGATFYSASPAPTGDIGDQVKLRIDAVSAATDFGFTVRRVRQG